MACQGIDTKWTLPGNGKSTVYLDGLMGGSWRFRFLRTYASLYSRFDDPNWWPGETPFEISVGAILTQNTAWTNVEKAIINLKNSDLLDPRSLLDADHSEISKCIQPAGYFNQKSEYLRNLSKLVCEDLSGDLVNLKRIEMETARSMLLEVKGIGKETADSILCYAAGMPVLVVDAYTWRTLGRLFSGRFLDEFPGRKYDHLAKFMMNTLNGDNTFYNRFHAFMVLLGKNICRKDPICIACPLLRICDLGSRFQNEEILESRE
jgi:endonuclease-3 related protein